MQLVGQDDEFGGILELNRWAGDFIGSKVSSVFRNAITTNPAAKTFHLIHSLSNLVFYHGFDRQAYKEQSNNSVASITARSLNLCSTPKYHKRIGKGVKTSMDVTFSYVAPGMPDLPIPGDTLKVSEWSLEKKTPFPLWKKTELSSLPKWNLLPFWGKRPVNLRIFFLAGCVRRRSSIALASRSLEAASS